MRMDDVLLIVKPDPDSQYKLLACKKCHSDDVAFVKYHHPDGPRWRVQCFNCGEILDPGEPAPRHTLQVEWNRRTT